MKSSQQWSITLMKSLTMNSNKKSGVGKFRHRSTFFSHIKFKWNIDIAFCIIYNKNTRKTVKSG